MSENFKSDTSDEHEIDFKAIGLALWGQRVFILAASAIGPSLALAISLAMPKVYTAEASILPMASANTASSMAAGLAAQLGPMAGMLNGLGGNKSADLTEIIASRSMTERVIDKCDLTQKLTGWKTHNELVRLVQKNTVITPPSLKNKIISIKFLAPNAELATLVTNTYIDELKYMLDEIGYNQASRNRKFIEAQLVKIKADLTDSENRLSKFQAEHRIASLPDTVVASIKSISDLEAQRIGAEVQLRSTDKALSDVRSRVQALQADPSTIIELEIKRNSLAAQQAALSKAKSEFIDELINLPPKAMELARIQRDVQVQNAIYLALTQQYETSVIDENRESDAFLLLDRAYVPDHPSSPKKALNVVLGLLIGSLVGICGALVRHRLLSRKHHS